MQVTQLATPQVLVDSAKLFANLDRMQAAVSARGLRLRPHAKTHKSPVIARWQVERGAVGICCAKLREAEVFVDAGIRDVRIAYPVNPANGSFLLSLMDRARISIVIDHPTVAEAWSDFMHRHGRTLDVLIKVDVGFHRCGIDPVAPTAMTFVRRIAQLPGLKLGGLLSHAGQGYGAASEKELAAIARTEAETLHALGESARRDGIAIEEVSVGATPTARFSLTQRGITEMRPGNYPYLDRMQLSLGAAQLSDCAFTVLGTVVSKPAADRLILDCGSKTLGSDPCRGFAAAALVSDGAASGTGYGLVFPDPEATSTEPSLLVERLSEEHAVVRVLSGRTRLEPGDLVRVLPNHACVVANLADCVRLVDGLEVVATLPVAARGRNT